MKSRPKSSWPAVAGRLAAALPQERLHPAVLDWVEANRRGGRWCVAFSGGADSLALLLLVWAHWPHRRARLTACHFNHRLRGRASTTDARFCRRVCAGLGIPLELGTWQSRPRLGSGTGKRKGPIISEAAARAARQAFFARTMA